jgi:hypothetical protein
MTRAILISIFLFRSKIARPQLDFRPLQRGFERAGELPLAGLIDLVAKLSDELSNTRRSVAMTFGII